MDLPKVHGAIVRMVEEEHQLWERESAGEASEADRARLAELKVALDQCWDLLRQRRAPARRPEPRRRRLRPPDVVEHYVP